jgi:sugar phosphate isomerase/epimerase
MRLGGPVFEKWSTPEEWARAVRALGYSAAYCPLKPDADDATAAAYAKAAKGADLVIAEVGAWGHNPISPDEEVRRKSIAGCQAALALADRIGARCCVNVSGARGERWAGPYAGNLSEATFDLVVESVRQIIDAVRPTRTAYALETMPWVFPDTVDSYARLVRAIERKRFAVHLDPVNLVVSPAIYFNTGALLGECFAKLGPHIRSCHAKDILLRDKLTVHLDEVRPGRGGLDYRAYLKELARLEPDMPLMIEHLPNAEEFRLAAEHIRSVAREAKVAIR